jgi:hypothetical protein
MSEIIELGAFSPDMAEVVRQLKQDLKDDWYPDSLGYEDALKPDVAAELLTACFNNNHGLYIRRNGRNSTFRRRDLFYATLWK